MTRIKRLFRPWLPIVFPALLLAGCSSIIDLPGGGEAPALYELRAFEGTPASESRNWVLIVETPSVPGAMRTDQIIVRLSERRLEYLAAARWSDRTPHLVGRYLEESIDNSGLVTVVGAGAVEIAGDYRLKVDIRDFSADVSGGATEVNVRFDALIVRSAPVAIIDRKQFSTSALAPGRKAGDIVGAFNRALDKSIEDLLVWLAEIPDTGGT